MQKNTRSVSTDTTLANKLVSDIKRRPKSGTWLKRNPFPRLINDTFCLKATYYQKGFYQFIRFDRAGDYNVFNALNYPKWLIFDMWFRDYIYCSPRLQAKFQETVCQIREMNLRHQRKVLEDKRTQKAPSKLILRGL